MMKRLDHEVIEKQEKIGSGHFGEVFSGLLAKSVPVAIKNLKANSTKANVDEFRKEAQLLRCVFNTDNNTVLVECQQNIFLALCS